MRSGILAALALAALPACIVEAPTGSPGESRAQPAALIDGPPLRVQSGANLEDKVEIVGAQFEPGRVGPGVTVKATVWFKVLAEVPQDYLIFVHVEDPAGKLERMNVDHAPVNGTRPTSGWNPGETIVDSFSITVPETATGLRGLNVWIGFWHASSDTRLRLKNTDDVKNDGRDRILLATLPPAR